MDGVLSRLALILEKQIWGVHGTGLLAVQCRKRIGSRTSNNGRSNGVIFPALTRAPVIRHMPQSCGMGSVSGWVAENSIRGQSNRLSWLGDGNTHDKEICSMCAAPIILALEEGLQSLGLERHNYLSCASSLHASAAAAQASGRHDRLLPEFVALIMRISMVLPMSRAGGCSPWLAKV